MQHLSNIIVYCIIKIHFLEYLENVCCMLNYVFDLHVVVVYVVLLLSNCVVVSIRCCFVLSVCSVV